MNNMILVNYKTHLFKAFGEDTPVFYISKASLTAVLLSKAKLFFSIFLPAANVTCKYLADFIMCLWKTLFRCCKKWPSVSTDENFCKFYKTLSPTFKKSWSFEMWFKTFNFKSLILIPISKFFDWITVRKVQF